MEIADCPSTNIVRAAPSFAGVFIPRAIGKALRSPAWHRHLRARRSKAVRRCRLAKQLGKPPAAKDAALLILHHGHSMGRGGKQEQWDEWQPASRSWQLWHGSWKQTRADGWQKGQRGQRGQPQTASFPAYDQGRAKGSNKGSNGKDDEEVLAPVVSGGLTQILQASLNSTRRTEQKVHSLAKALSEREQLWNSYEQDLKTAYRKEHARYLRDMERLRTDLQKATAAQAGARADLLRVFQTGGRVEDTAEDPCVDQMVASWRAEPDVTDMQSVLQRAIAAIGGCGVPSVPRPATHGAWNAAPPGLAPPDAGLPTVCSGQDGASFPAGVAEAAASQLDSNMGVGEYLASIPRDPYLLSPSQTACVGLAPSPAPPQGVHYKAADGTRLPVKTKPPMATPPWGGTSLGNKLEAKRNALAPFGGPASRDSAAAEPAAVGEPPTETFTGGPFLSDAEIQARLHHFAAPSGAHLVDDDDDTSAADGA